MERVVKVKKAILLIIAAVVICSGFYSDVCETNKPVFHSDSFSVSDDHDGGYPLKDRVDAKVSHSLIATVAETKGVGTTKDAIKRTGTCVDNKRHGRNTLNLGLYPFLGEHSFNALSTVFQLTDNISSRNSIISYIHLQDGEKPSK